MARNAAVCVCRAVHVCIGVHVCIIYKLQYVSVLVEACRILALVWCIIVEY